MARLYRVESPFARATARRLARWALIPAFVLLLAGCGGGSSSGGGTANSRFVGTYDGFTSVTVSANDGAAAASESVTVFVNQDGLVQVGDARSTIFASGPLRGDTLRIDGDAAALVDPNCSGIITLTGVFETGDDGGAGFEGSWSSSDAQCYGTAGTVDGTVTASRVSANARASRVFETSSNFLQRAFRQAAD